MVIPKAEQDKKLPEKLQDELSGVLRWIAEGCLGWQREGLGEPDAVVAATGQYRQDMDILAAFIEDRCVVRENVSAGATPLYGSYREWCEENGEHAVKQKTFGRSLRERGFEQKRDPTTQRKV